MDRNSSGALELSATHTSDSNESEDAVLVLSYEGDFVPAIVERGDINERHPFIHSGLIRETANTNYAVNALQVDDLSSKLHKVKVEQSDFEYSAENAGHDLTRKRHRHVEMEKNLSDEEDDIFDNSSDEEDWVIERRKRYRCHFCKVMLKTKATLNRHILRHEEKGSVNQCRFCSYKTIKKKQLREHEFTHTDKPHMCPLCSFSSRTKSDLGKHMIVHNSEKRFACSICSFRTKWRKGLETHMRTHATDRPYTCSQCDQAFKSSSVLKSHIYRRHSDDKPLMCERCPFRCKSNFELNYHKTSHSDERPYPCPYPGCHWALKTKSDLTKHTRTHIDEKKHVCEVCGKRFRWSMGLKAHASVHMHERNFECDHCAKRFKTLKALMKHMTLHRGIRPFRCDVCFKTYRSRNNLLSHKQVHEGDRPFKCPMCVYAGRELDHLLVHLGTDHLNDYTYFCSLCRKPFGRSFNLQTHLKLCHRKEIGDADDVLVYDPKYLDLDLQLECCNANKMHSQNSEPASEGVPGASQFQCSRKDIKTEPTMLGTFTTRNNDAHEQDASGVGKCTSSFVKQEMRPLPLGKLAPVIQIGKLGGISFCLARKGSGFEFNFQKKGKKPRKWFMSTEHMNAEDAKRYQEFLLRKEGKVQSTHTKGGHKPKQQVNSNINQTQHRRHETKTLAQSLKQSRNKKLTLGKVSLGKKRKRTYQKQVSTSGETADDCPATCVKKSKSDAKLTGEKCPSPRTDNHNVKKSLKLPRGEMSLLDEVSGVSSSQHKSSTVSLPENALSNETTLLPNVAAGIDATAKDSYVSAQAVSKDVSLQSDTALQEFIMPHRSVNCRKKTVTPSNRKNMKQMPQRQGQKKRQAVKSQCLKDRVLPQVSSNKIKSEPFDFGHIWACALVAQDTHTTCPQGVDIVSDNNLTSERGPAHRHLHPSQKTHLLTSPIEIKKTLRVVLRDIVSKDGLNLYANSLDKTCESAGVQMNADAPHPVVKSRVEVENCGKRTGKDSSIAPLSVAETTDAQGTAAMFVATAVKRQSPKAKHIHKKSASERTTVRTKLSTVTVHSHRDSTYSAGEEDEGQISLPLADGAVMKVEPQDMNTTIPLENLVNVSENKGENSLEKEFMSTNAVHSESSSQGNQAGDSTGPHTNQRTLTKKIPHYAGNSDRSLKCAQSKSLLSVFTAESDSFSDITDQSVKRDLGHQTIGRQKNSPIRDTGRQFYGDMAVRKSKRPHKIRPPVIHPHCLDFLDRVKHSPHQSITAEIKSHSLKYRSPQFIPNCINEMVHEREVQSSCNLYMSRKEVNVDLAEAKLNPSLSLLPEESASTQLHVRSVGRTFPSHCHDNQLNTCPDSQLGTGNQETVVYNLPAHLKPNTLVVSSLNLEHPPLAHVHTVKPVLMSNANQLPRLDMPNESSSLFVTGTDQTVTALTSITTTVGCKDSCSKKNEDVVPLPLDLSVASCRQRNSRPTVSVNFGLETHQTDEKVISTFHASLLEPSTSTILDSSGIDNSQVTDNSLKKDLKNICMAVNTEMTFSQQIVTPQVNCSKFHKKPNSQSETEISQSGLSASQVKERPTDSNLSASHLKEIVALSDLSASQLKETVALSDLSTSHSEELIALSNLSSFSIKDAGVIEQGSCVKERRDVLPTAVARMPRKVGRPRKVKQLDDSNLLVKTSTKSQSMDTDVTVSVKQTVGNAELLSDFDSSVVHLIQTSGTCPTANNKSVIKNSKGDMPKANNRFLERMGTDASLNTSAIKHSNGSCSEPLKPKTRRSYQVIKDTASDDSIVLPHRICRGRKSAASTTASESLKATMTATSESLKTTLTATLENLQTTSAATSENLQATSTATSQSLKNSATPLTAKRFMKKVGRPKKSSNSELDTDLCGKTSSSRLDTDLCEKTINSRLDTDLCEKTTNSRLDTDLCEKTINSRLDTDLCEKTINSRLDTDLCEKTIKTLNSRLDTDLCEKTINSRLDTDLCEKTINSNDSSHILDDSENRITGLGKMLVTKIDQIQQKENTKTLKFSAKTVTRKRCTLQEKCEYDTTLSKQASKTVTRKRCTLQEKCEYDTTLSKQASKTAKYKVSVSAIENIAPIKCTSSTRKGSKLTTSTPRRVSKQFPKTICHSEKSEKFVCKKSENLSEFDKTNKKVRIMKNDKFKPEKKLMKRNCTQVPGIGKKVGRVKLKKNKSAFKIVKPPSKKMKHCADSMEKSKRKKYMYTELDLGITPECTPVKKRGRLPGPKVILDKSQVDLCLLPPVLPMETDKIILPIASRNSSKSDNFSSPCLLPEAVLCITPLPIPPIKVSPDLEKPAPQKRRRGRPRRVEVIDDSTKLKPCLLPPVQLLEHLCNKNTTDKESEEIKDVEYIGADYLHVDLSDHQLPLSALEAKVAEQDLHVCKTREGKDNSLLFITCAVCKDKAREDNSSFADTHAEWEGELGKDNSSVLDVSVACECETRTDNASKLDLAQKCDGETEKGGFVLQNDSENLSKPVTTLDSQRLPGGEKNYQHVVDNIFNIESSQDNIERNIHDQKYPVVLPTVEWTREQVGVIYDGNVLVTKGRDYMQSISQNAVNVERAETFCPYPNNDCNIKAEEVCHHQAKTSLSASLTTDKERSEMPVLSHDSESASILLVETDDKNLHDKHGTDLDCNSFACVQVISDSASAFTTGKKGKRLKVEQNSSDSSITVSTVDKLQTSNPSSGSMDRKINNHRNRSSVRKIRKKGHKVTIIKTPAMENQTSHQAEGYFDVSSHAEGNTDMSSQAEENADVSSQAEGNADVSSQAEENVDVSSQAEENADVSSQAEENVDVSSQAEGNADVSSQAEENVDVSSKAERNDVSSHIERNVEVCSQAEENAELSSQAERNVEMSNEAEEIVNVSSQVEENVDVSSQAERNDEVYSQTERNDEVCSQIERNVEVYSQAERNDEVYSQAERNVEMSNEAEEIANVSSQAERNDEVYSQDERNDEVYSQIERNVEVYSQAERNVEMSNEAEEIANVSSPVERNIDVSNHVERNIEVSSQVEGNAEVSSQAGENVEVSCYIEGNVEVSNQTERNVEMSNQTERNVEMSNQTERNVEMSSQTERNDELSNQTERNVEMSSQTERNVELSNQTERNVEMSNQTERNVEMSNQTERNVEMSNQTERNVEMSSQTERNVELSNQTERNVEMSNQTERNVEMSSQTERNVELSNQTERNVEMSSQTERNVELSNQTERNVEMSNQTERNVESSYHTEEIIKMPCQIEGSVEISNHTEEIIKTSTQIKGNVESNQTKEILKIFNQAEENVDISIQVEEDVEVSSQAKENVELSSQTKDNLEIREKYQAGVLYNIEQVLPIHYTDKTMECSKIGKQIDIATSKITDNIGISSPQNHIVCFMDGASDNNGATDESRKTLERDNTPLDNETSSLIQSYSRNSRSKLLNVNSPSILPNSSLVQKEMPAVTDKGENVEINLKNKNMNSTAQESVAIAEGSNVVSNWMVEEHTPIEITLPTMCKRSLGSPCEYGLPLLENQSSTDGPCKEQTLLLCRVKGDSGLSDTSFPLLDEPDQDVDTSKPLLNKAVRDSDVSDTGMPLLNEAVQDTNVSDTSMPLLHEAVRDSDASDTDVPLLNEAVQEISMPLLHEAVRDSDASDTNVPLLNEAVQEISMPLLDEAVRDSDASDTDVPLLNEAIQDSDESDTSVPSYSEAVQISDINDIGMPLLNDVDQDPVLSGTSMPLLNKVVRDSDIIDSSMPLLCGANYDSSISDTGFRREAEGSYILNTFNHKTGEKITCLETDGILRNNSIYSDHSQHFVVKTYDNQKGLSNKPRLVQEGRKVEHKIDISVCEVRDQYNTEDVSDITTCEVTTSITPDTSLLIDSDYITVNLTLTEDSNSEVSFKGACEESEVLMLSTSDESVDSACEFAGQNAEAIGKASAKFTSWEGKEDNQSYFTNIPILQYTNNDNHIEAAQREKLLPEVHLQESTPTKMGFKVSQAHSAQAYHIFDPSPVLITQSGSVASTLESRKFPDYETVNENSGLGNESTISESYSFQNIHKQTQQIFLDAEENLSRLAAAFPDAESARPAAFNIKVDDKVGSHAQLVPNILSEASDSLWPLPQYLDSGSSLTSSCTGDGVLTHDAAQPFSFSEGATCALEVFDIPETRFAGNPQSSDCRTVLNIGTTAPIGQKMYHNLAAVCNTKFERMSSEDAIMYEEGFVVDQEPLLSVQVGESPESLMCPDDSMSSFEEQCSEFTTEPLCLEPDEDYGAEAN